MPINKDKIVKILSHSFTFFLAIVITVLFQEPIKHVINRYYLKAELSYEIMSITKLSRHELQEYSKVEKLISLNLNLDDLILNNYVLVKMKLRNEGIPIKQSLKLRTSIDKTSAKIIDIQHKVNTPINKIVPILYTIPNLTWSIEKANSQFYKPTFTWDAPKTNVDGSPIVFGIHGYNIYRSKLKDIGFGKINAKLIKNPWYVDYSPDMSNTMFYKVQPTKKAGVVGKLSDPLSITLPEELAFSPLFKNVVWVDPDMEIKVHDDKIKYPVYYTLKEALEREHNASTLIINKYREEKVSSDNFVKNIRDDIKILYLDDLRFLNGQTDILLTSGLDKDAEIIFYFIIKIYPEVAFDFKLMLDGQPDIRFIEKQSTVIENSLPDKTQNASTPLDKKASITPQFATAFVGKKTIYILWEHTATQEYKGVRIFRAKKNSIYDPDQLGVEIYDGVGNSNNLNCDAVIDDKIINPNKSDPPPKPPKKISFPNEPPQKELVSPFTPTAPMNLRVTGRYKLQIISSDDNILHFYADGDVISNKIYSYVLYAYDNKNNYSYPVVVNATLNDPANDIICNTANN